MKVKQVRTGEKARVVCYAQGNDPFWVVETDKGCQWWLPVHFELLQDVDELKADYIRMRSGIPGEKDLVQKGWSIAHQQQMRDKDAKADRV